MLLLEETPSFREELQRLASEVQDGPERAALNYPEARGRKRLVRGIAQAVDGAVRQCLATTAGSAGKFAPFCCARKNSRLIEHVHDDGEQDRVKHNGKTAKPQARELRFVDLCAGLGGFHLALTKAQEAPARRKRRHLEYQWTFRCVMAADILPRLRESYVQNFPEIVEEYRTLYPPERCPEVGLDDLYNEAGRLVRIHGDLATLVDVEKGKLRCWEGTNEPIVPEHELLCAGFPCQPFSKSGAQLGFEDLNGTVFRMLAVILKERQPPFVFLENVGNFERHDKGNTWKVVRQILVDLGYSVRATTTVGGEDGGLGLVSPHHIGLPQHRERFFIVAQHKQKAGPFHNERYPFPKSYRTKKNPERALAKLERDSRSRLLTIINRSANKVPREELEAAQVSPERARCVDHWRKLLVKIDEHDSQCEADQKIRPLPSFPIWGFELDPWHHYPYETNPKDLVADPTTIAHYRRGWLRKIRVELGSALAPTGSRSFLDSGREADIERWVKTWPGYARDRGSWPSWKRRFIEQNRGWSQLLWNRLDRVWLRSWLEELFSEFPSASHHKLEWNCQGEDVDLWQHILQFRPSGIRVKRFRHIPALVAMTTTQIPIIPVRNNGRHPPARHLLASEALALQGFPRSWNTPAAKGPTFEALGNAVHVGLVKAIVLAWLFEDGGPYDAQGNPLPPREADCKRIEVGQLVGDEAQIRLPFLSASQPCTELGAT